MIDLIFDLIWPIVIWVDLFFISNFLKKNVAFGDVVGKFELLRCRNESSKAQNKNPIKCTKQSDIRKSTFDCQRRSSRGEMTIETTFFRVASHFFFFASPLLKLKKKIQIS